MKDKIEYEFKVLSQDDLQDKVCLIVGTRPGIIMFSPIIRALENTSLDFFIIHTGQHYSYNMDKVFFEDLSLSPPTCTLDTGRYCRYHGEQTGEMLKGIERALLKERPRVVLVGGDANTNLAGALAARKLHICVGHVEAGERSYDWRMPEEHNRRMIDHISDYLFVTNEKSKKNLLKENILGKIFITGNTIVDAAYQNLAFAEQKSGILSQFDVQPKSYFVLTTHREENVDSPEKLRGIFIGMQKVFEKFKKKIIFLAHPRTQKMIGRFGLQRLVWECEHLVLCDAVGYLDFIILLANAGLIFTDSGGVQQESCIFKVPCVTLRDNTEWAETIELGINILAGTKPDNIVKSAHKILYGKKEWGEPFGDGKAADRIVEIVRQECFEGRNSV